MYILKSPVAIGTDLHGAEQCLESRKKTAATRTKVVNTIVCIWRLWYNSGAGGGSGAISIAWLALG